MLNVRPQPSCKSIHFCCTTELHKKQTILKLWFINGFFNVCTMIFQHVKQSDSCTHFRNFVMGVIIGSSSNYFHSIKKKPCVI